MLKRSKWKLIIIMFFILNTFIISAFLSISSYFTQMYFYNYIYMSDNTSDLVKNLADYYMLFIGLPLTIIWLYLLVRYIRYK